jgi:pyruvate dehydrogenase E2 component (dihydrolipoamide acetyltransferase)
MSEIVMPRLSDTMEEGTILRWLKADGEEVARGEELVEIETDKATMIYESDQAGTLSLIAAEGDTLPVGQPIARVGEGGAPPPAADMAPAEQQDDQGNGVRSGPSEAVASPPAQEPSTPSTTDGSERVKASPLARRIAREEGVSLEGLTGSGPGGRIVKADVPMHGEETGDALAGQAPPGAGATSSASSGDAAASQANPDAGGPPGESPPSMPGPSAPSASEGANAAASPGSRAAAVPPAPHSPALATSAATAAPSAPATPDAIATAKGATTEVELNRLQQTVARRMAEAKATIPEFTIQLDVDMEECVALRAELKRLAAGGTGPAPSYNDMVVKASALALREHPKANGSYKDGRLLLHSRINVGVAVAAEGALVVPTVFDADAKALGEIARETRVLIERVRDSSITPPELGGGTFTVSNLGMFGIRSFTAIINPPQAAILSVGALERRATVREEPDGTPTILARHLLTLTLVCDHRILFGAEAAQFLERVRELLQSPTALTL